MTRRMYLEVMKIFEGRNFKKERVQLRKEADNLVSTAKVSQFARKGHYMLEKARGNVDSDQPLMDKLLFDPTRVQMKYMNGYLNHYTEKLARANADEPSDIQIDKQDLYLIAKSVRADEFNPYLHAQGIKD